MDDLLPIAVLVLVAIAGFVTLFRVGVRRITVLEYEKGLKYTRGSFRSVLGPGQYWYLPFFTIIQKLDVRPRFVSITGQEVLSADGITLRLSLAAKFEITDPTIAINRVQNFQEALYLELQLALRAIVGAVEVDAVLGGRNELSKTLMQIAEPKATDLGLKLISVELKDIMFPGKLKEMFAQVVNAKQEGLAALEKARGETAALRNLANAAKLLDANPNLMQLRLLQAFDGASGNSLIVGVPSPTVPVSIPADKKS
jgi:regulator of protease activity HflC (stomatin/prohibitin superfamily)